MFNILKLCSLIFLVSIFASCGQLPRDNSPAPIDHGHYTLEMHYGNSFDVGLLGAKEDFDSPKIGHLKIPVWHKGKISVESKRCVYSKTKDFSDKEEIKFSTRELIKNAPNEEFACIFNVYLFVEGLDRGLQGQFYLLRDEGFSPIDFNILGTKYNTVGWHQFAKGYNPNIRVEFNTNKSGTIFFQGCGASDQKSFSSNPSFKLGELIPDGSSCLMTVGLIYDDGSKAIAELNLKVFSNKVLEIADPSIEFKRKRLKIRSRKPVGYVSINDKTKKGRRLSKRVGNSTAWVRLVTANGRYKLIGVKKGDIVWRPSIKY